MPDCDRLRLSEKAEQEIVVPLSLNFHSIGTQLPVPMWFPTKAV